MASSTKRKRGPIGQTVEFILTIAVAVLAALLIQRFVVKPYRIPSGSMIPTLQIGQRILANRLSGNPSIGDVVVFHPPTAALSNTNQCGDPSQGPGDAAPCDKAVTSESSQTFIKRVIAGPGDTVKISNGKVYVNGVEQKAPYARACTASYVCNFRKSIKIPAGHYFMMGDNRVNSDDSRFWGPVPSKWIIGQAFFTYWPPDRIGTL